MGDFEELDYEELDFEEADDEGLFELGIAPEEMDELDTEQTPDRSAPSLGKEAAVTSDSVPTVTVTTNSLKLYGLELVLNVVGYGLPGGRFECILCQPSKSMSELDLKRHMGTPCHLKGVLQLTDTKLYNQCQFSEDTQALQENLGKVIEGKCEGKVLQALNPQQAIKLRQTITTDIAEKRKTTRDNFIKALQDKQSNSSVPSTPTGNIVKPSLASRLGPRVTNVNPGDKLTASSPTTPNVGKVENMPAKLPNTWGIKSSSNNSVSEVSKAKDVSTFNVKTSNPPNSLATQTKSTTFASPTLSKPAASLSKPAPALSKPAVALSKPAVALSKPAVALSKPAVALSKPAPALSKPAPALSNPAPALSNPASTPSKPALTLSKPALTLSKPALTLSKPAPTLSKPAPTLSKPAPTLSKPAPTLSKPAPTLSKPAPTLSKPAPTPSTPAPTPVTPGPAGGKRIMVDASGNFWTSKSKVAGTPTATASPNQQPASNNSTAAKQVVPETTSLPAPTNEEATHDKNPGEPFAGISICTPITPDVQDLCMAGKRLHIKGVSTPGADIFITKFLSSLKGRMTPVFDKRIGWLVAPTIFGEAIIVVMVLNNYRLLNFKFSVKLYNEKSFRTQMDKSTKRVDLAITLCKHLTRKYNKDTTEEIRKEILKAIDLCSYQIKKCTRVNCKNPCFSYHIESQKRRDFRQVQYCSETCCNPPGFCFKNADCRFCHSYTEKLLHPKNFLVNICRNVDAAGKCKAPQPCPAAHRGSPDMFYHESWIDLYLSGLEKSFLFAAGAMRNLFKVVGDYSLSRQQRPHVLFLTASEDIVTAASNILSSVASLHWLQINASGQVSGDVILSTPSMLLSPSSDYKPDSFSQLAALILDDAPALLSEECKADTLKIVNSIGCHSAVPGGKVHKVLTSNELTIEQMNTATDLLKTTFSSRFTASGTIDTMQTSLVTPSEELNKALCNEPAASVVSTSVTSNSSNAKPTIALGKMLEMELNQTAVPAKGIHSHPSPSNAKQSITSPSNVGQVAPNLATSKPSVAAPKVQLSISQQIRLSTSPVKKVETLPNPVPKAGPSISSPQVESSGDLISKVLLATPFSVIGTSKAAQKPADKQADQSSSFSDSIASWQSDSIKKMLQQTVVPLTEAKTVPQAKVSATASPKGSKSNSLTKIKAGCSTDSSTNDVKKETVLIDQTLKKDDLEKKKITNSGQENTNAAPVVHDWKSHLLALQKQPLGKKETSMQDQASIKEEPSDQQQKEYPFSLQKQKGSPGSQKQLQKGSPDTQQQRNIPGNQQKKESPSNQQQRNIPGIKQQKESPSNQQQRNVPGNQKPNCTPDNERQAVLSGKPFQKGISGNQFQREVTDISGSRPQKVPLLSLPKGGPPQLNVSSGSQWRGSQFQQGCPDDQQQSHDSDYKNPKRHPDQFERGNSGPGHNQRQREDSANQYHRGDHQQRPGNQQQNKLHGQKGILVNNFPKEPEKRDFAVNQFEREKSDSLFQQGRDQFKSEGPGNRQQKRGPGEMNMPDNKFQRGLGERDMPGNRFGRGVAAERDMPGNKFERGGPAERDMPGNRFGRGYPAERDMPGNKFERGRPAERDMPGNRFGRGPGEMDMPGNKFERGGPAERDMPGNRFGRGGPAERDMPGNRFGRGGPAERDMPGNKFERGGPAERDMAGNKFERGRPAERDMPGNKFERGRPSEREIPGNKFQRGPGEMDMPGNKFERGGPAERDMPGNKFQRGGMDQNNQFPRDIPFNQRNMRDDQLHRGSPGGRFQRGEPGNEYQDEKFRREGPVDRFDRDGHSNKFQGSGPPNKFGRGGQQQEAGGRGSQSSSYSPHDMLVKQIHGEQPGKNTKRQTNQQKRAIEDSFDSTKFSKRPKMGQGSSSYSSFDNTGSLEPDFNNSDNINTSQIPAVPVKNQNLAYKSNWNDQKAGGDGKFKRSSFGPNSGAHSEGESFPKPFDAPKIPSLMDVPVDYLSKNKQSSNHSQASSFDQNKANDLHSAMQQSQHDRNQSSQGPGYLRDSSSYSKQGGFNEFNAPKSDDRAGFYSSNAQQRPPNSYKGHSTFSESRFGSQAPSQQSAQTYDRPAQSSANNNWEKNMNSKGYNGSNSEEIDSQGYYREPGMQSWKQSEGTYSGSKQSYQGKSYRSGQYDEGSQAQTPYKSHQDEGFSKDYQGNRSDGNYHQASNYGGNQRVNNHSNYQQQAERNAPSRYQNSGSEKNQLQDRNVNSGGYQFNSQQNQYSGTSNNQQQHGYDSGYQIDYNSPGYNQSYQGNNSQGYGNNSQSYYQANKAAGQKQAYGTENRHENNTQANNWGSSSQDNYKSSISEGGSYDGYQNSGQQNWKYGNYANQNSSGSNAPSYSGQSASQYGINYNSGSNAGYSTSAKFNAEEAYAMFEALSSSLDMLAPAMTALIAVARSRGSNTPEAMKLFVDREHSEVVKLCLESFKEKMKTAPGPQYAKLQQAVAIGQRLLSYAQEMVPRSSVQKRGSASLDVGAIAKATMGQDEGSVMNYIKRTAHCARITHFTSTDFSELLFKVMELQKNFRQNVNKVDLNDQMLSAMMNYS